MTYPNTGHWTRSLIISPKGDRLFVSVGSGSNVNIEYPPRAAVTVARLDGTDSATFASGLRNTVGIDFHPKTGDLYVAVQERDQIGDDLVPDYFTRIQNNEFYGWPFAYLSSKNVDPRRRFPNGTSERPDLVESTLTPDVLFESHSAVLDMQFYRGTQFPTHYQNGAFASFHGSWNRHAGTGYKLVFIPFGNNNRPLGYYEEFLKGFLIDPQGPTTWGRPVGMFEMKDGSLLVSEDGNNRLYRIEYVKSI
jgi:glucose/arabinose dehydrogenase